MFESPDIKFLECETNAWISVDHIFTSFQNELEQGMEVEQISDWWVV